MIDIYCKNGKCPICDSELEYEITDYICPTRCKNNGCYEFYGCYIGYKYVHFFKIYSTTFIIEKFLGFYWRGKNKVKKNIKYWKENDRYLAEILLKE